MGISTTNIIKDFNENLCEKCNTELHVGAIFCGNCGIAQITNMSDEDKIKVLEEKIKSFTSQNDNKTKPPILVAEPPTNSNLTVSMKNGVVEDAPVPAGVITNNPEQVTQFYDEWKERMKEDPNYIPLFYDKKEPHDYIPKLEWEKKWAQPNPPFEAVSNITSYPKSFWRLFKFWTWFKR